MYHNYVQCTYNYDMMLINNVLSPITLNDYLLYLSLSLARVTCEGYGS